jgi:hypothetical protein
MAGDESTAINELLQGMSRRVESDPADQIVKWDHPGAGAGTQDAVSLRSARSFRMVTAPIGVKTGIPPIVKQVVQQHLAQRQVEDDDEVTRFVPRLPVGSPMPQQTPIPMPAPRQSRAPSRPAIAVVIARRLAVPMIGVALASAIVTYIVMRTRATPAAAVAVQESPIVQPVAPAPAPEVAPAHVTVTPIPEPPPAPETAPVEPPPAPETAPVDAVAEPKVVTPKVAEPKVDSEPAGPREEREQRRAKKRAQTDEVAAFAATQPADDEPSGLLMISTKPPCEIVIDGKRTGMLTPQRAIRLSPGSHKIELINEAEAIRSSATVEISPDEPTKLIRNFMLSTQR